MKGSVDNMKFEQLVELIQTVSSSNLGEFKYEEGDFKISLKKEKGEVRLAEQSESVPARASEQPQDSSEKKSGNVIKSPLVGNLLCITGRGCRSVCTGGRAGTERKDSGNRGSNEADE